MRKGFFAGRIGKDAELRYTNNQKAVCNFSLAVDTRAAGEKATLWVDCALWGDRAEKLHQYLLKGMSVAVVGDVAVRAYEHGGEARAQLLCVIYDVTFQGGAGEPKEDVRAPQARAQAEGARAAQARPQAAPEPDLDDDIPF